MKLIENIDLWNETKVNYQECFNGAFTDGFNGDNIPFDSFKIVKNCNCNIISFPKIRLNNKHKAIVFYKNGEPVRLLVANKDTNIEERINDALKQVHNGELLVNLFNRLNITSTTVDLKEEPRGRTNIEPEAEIGSANRSNLLKSMLKGSWTEDESDIGYDKEDNENKKILLPKDQRILYLLATDTEYFRIDHRFAFKDSKSDIVIPVQKNFKR